MSERKKPYTTAELFEIINAKLKAEGLLPESILDYGLATRNVIPVKKIEWDTIGIVNFGDSEGIYLDIYLDGVIDEENERKHASCGLYKTLETNKNAFKTMSDLNAEFVFALREMVYENMDDFTWTGYDVRLYSDDGKYHYGYSEAPSLERAKSLAERDINRYNGKLAYAIIVDNATKKETRYEPELSATA